MMSAVYLCVEAIAAGALATTTKQAVWLESGAAPSATADDGGVWMLVLFGIAATLVAAAVIVWLYGAALDKPNAETLAFRRLARLLRIGREDRRIVERLAEAQAGIAPVALLISERAFREAAERAMALQPAPNARRVAELGTLLFR